MRTARGVRRSRHANHSETVSRLSRFTHSLSACHTTQATISRKRMVSTWMRGGRVEITSVFPMDLWACRKQPKSRGPFDPERLARTARVDITLWAYLTEGRVAVVSGASVTLLQQRIWPVYFFARASSAAGGTLLLCFSSSPEEGMPANAKFPNILRACFCICCCISRNAPALCSR